jgi:hypothetical protein
MQIAQQKKGNNIAEYILYMWQLEDIVRANRFDALALNNILVKPLSLDDDNKKQIESWYGDLITKMKIQKLDEKGHLDELNDLIVELQYLHETLLNVLNDKKYEKLYLSSKLNIDALKSKSGSTKQSEISVCLNGLYGLLLLRLKKEKISTETNEAMQSISKLIAYLASKYKTASQAS